MGGPMTPADRTRLLDLLDRLVDGYTSSDYNPERNRIVDCADVLREHLRGMP